MKSFAFVAFLLPALVLAEPQVLPISKKPFPVLKLETLSKESIKRQADKDSLRARAPRVVGNGGDAVVCTDSHGRKTAELLDYYEARALRGIAIDLGPEELSVSEKVDMALSRLALSRPERAAGYAYRIENFYRDAQFLKGYRLQDIADSKHVSLPRGCEIEQLVIQRPVRPANEALFLVNEDIWDLLDNTNKAGILLHEAIYEEALQMNANNSINTRYLNSKISSSLPVFRDEMEANCFFFNLGLESARSYEIWNRCQGRN